TWLEVADTFRIALAAPGSMWAVAGSKNTSGRVVERLTVMPPTGARPLTRTMTLPKPPARIRLCRLRLLWYASRIVTCLVLVTPPRLAVTVTVLVFTTGTVVMPISSSVAPELMCAYGGTGIEGSDEVRATLSPPTGAGALLL